MDIAAAACWSFFLVNSIRLQQDDIFPDAAFKQNLGIYAVVIGARMPEGDAQAQVQVDAPSARGSRGAFSLST